MSFTTPGQDFSPKDLTGTCHCGLVSYALETAPKWYSECKCTLCIRYGVLWAYYPVETVHVRTKADSGLDTQTYTRKDGILGMHFCPTCHNLIFWKGLDPNDPRVEGEMGVNVRLLPREVWEKNPNAEHRVTEGPEEP